MHGEFQISWLQLFGHWRVFRREDGQSIGCIEGDGARFIASVALGDGLVPVAYGASVHEVGMALVAYVQMDVKVPSLPVPDNIRSFQGVK